MEPEILKYRDWKTGEEVESILRDHHPYERINPQNLICPFDKTPLIHSYDDFNNDIICVNCGEYYSGRSQIEINKEANEILQQRKQELIKLENQKSQLEKRVAFYESSLK